MGVLILTNNPLVKEREPRALFVDGTAREVLLAARDLIHCGHRLLTHPMAGSIPPDTMPYRSLLLAKAGDAPDLDSLALIEAGVRAAARAPSTDGMSAALRHDFQRIEADFLDYDYAGGNTIWN